MRCRLHRGSLHRIFHRSSWTITPPYHRISEVRRMLIVCCHCCVVSCHCCAHTLLTFCFVDPRLLATAGLSNRTKALAKAGAAAADLAARLAIADLRCAPSCTCPLSQRLFYRCLFYPCLTPLVDCDLRTCLLRTCLIVGTCRAEVKKEAAAADTTISVTGHIVHLRYAPSKGDALSPHTVRVDKKS